MYQSESSDFQPEDVIVQQQHLNKTILMASRDLNNEEHRTLLKMLKDAFKIPDSLFGLATVTREFLLDLKALSKTGFSIETSIDLLSDFYKALNQSTNTDADLERSQARSLNIYEIRLMIRPFFDGYTIQEKQQVRAIRGLFIYFSICKSSSLSQELILSLNNLITGKTDYKCFLGKSFNELKELKIESGDDVEKFANTLKKYTSTEGLSLNEIIKKSVTPNKPTYTTSKVAQADNKVEYDKDEINKNYESEFSSEVKRPNDHIGNLKYLQQFNGQRENSGIIERFEYLMPYELEIIIPSIINDLLDENLSTQAIACLLTFLLRCRPNRFHMIGLQQSESNSAWIDLEKKIFCWDLNKLTEIKQKNNSANCIVKIPLPNELILGLKEMHAKASHSKTLAELFNISQDVLDGMCKRYIKTKSLTSHRPTLTRLEETYGKYVSAIVKDEVYASAIGLDFSLGVTSNFNYTVIKGERLRQILVDVYSRLGFIQIELPLMDNAAAPNAINPNHVCDLINKLTGNISGAISHITKNIRFERLIEIHNEISKNTLCLTAVLTGHRSAEEYGFFAFTVDTDKKICLLSDKRVSDYQWGRVVPLASLVANHLELYFHWLESLKNRLSKISKKLSNEVTAVINANPERPLPLFFKVEGQQIFSLGTKSIQYLFDEFNLPSNCGRDYLDFILKKQNVDSTSVMMLEGHASMGQEQISISSLVNLPDIINILQEKIDIEISEFSVEKTPKYNPRTTKLSNQIVYKNNNKTILSAKYENKNSLAPQCPFDEFSIINISLFKQQSEEWISLKSKISIQDLHFSLCMIDGIASEVELSSVVEELLYGSIYQIDGKFFVDSITPNLGYRRVWISYLTVLIAANLTENQHDLKVETNNQKLISAVQSQYLMNAPASLALWAKGIFSSRCSRPETLSRHYYDQAEIPTYADSTNKKTFHFDDKSMQSAINRAVESEKYNGTNQTRLKHLEKEIDEILQGEIDEISVLIQVKYAKYLTTKKLAATTISRYYSASKSFIDIFVNDLDQFSQLATIDWQTVIEEWIKLENIKIDENSPEVTAVNHFLEWVESNTKISRTEKKLSSPVTIPADYPSLNEIRRTYNLIKDDISLSDAIKLEALSLLSLISLHALRPSEARSIRLIDVFTGQSVHVVITCEALGRVKTINANRVLEIDDDEFNTKEMLKKLHSVKSKNNAPNSYLFTDGTGLNLTWTHEIFKIIRSALHKVTGHPTTIMSFRQFNATRDISLVIKNAGKNPLLDRTSLPRVAAQCGHGHPLTTYENYGCDLDLRRKEFWENHKKNIKYQAPVSNIKKRLGLEFNGNLAINKPSFELLSELISSNYEFIKRIKTCKDYVRPIAEIKEIEKPRREANIDEACKYVFQLSIGTSIEDAVVESRINFNQKKCIDNGVNFISQSFFKEFKSTNERNFRDKLLRDEFQKRLNVLQSLPVYKPQAIILAQIIPQNLDSVIDITHLSQTDLFVQQHELFRLAGVEIYICTNKNIPVEIRKSLRRTPFKTLPEQSFSQSIQCQLSFWLIDLPFSQRARNLSQVMQEINLILLTFLFLKLGE